MLGLYVKVDRMYDSTFLPRYNILKWLPNIKHFTPFRLKNEYNEREIIHLYLPHRMKWLSAVHFEHRDYM